MYSYQLWHKFCIFRKNVKYNIKNKSKVYKTVPRLYTAVG